MPILNDFCLRLRDREYVPLIIGGMGVDISTRGLAVEAARLGGIGHISDAMVPTVVDKDFRTSYVSNKLRKYKFNVANRDKSVVKFDLGQLAEATRRHVSETMEASHGPGAIFINCMEKLTMNNPAETLKVRLESAMDAGIEGITLSAGLHLGSLGLVKDHPRFNDVNFGIIVSSVRALNLFLRKSRSTGRLPDFIIVEGPLAGGHLGFGMDWRDYDLRTIVADVLAFLKEHELPIPVIPAGGIFTGAEGVQFLEMGARAIQVATRFTVAKECGLPNDVKQEYFKAREEDIVVNLISPTGYPMRMIRQSPAIGAGIRPNCEAYGYLLDRNGHCAYVDAYNAALAEAANPKEISVKDKTCLCTHMRNFKVWTCGHNTYRLKELTRQAPDGSYEMSSAEQIFREYQYGEADAGSRQESAGLAG
jgi:nitronate monooxygenase